MVRHLSKKSKGNKQKRHPAKRSDAKLARWETADDIPLDEEDACELGTRLRGTWHCSSWVDLSRVVVHASKDKVLFDGDEYDGDSDGDDDEVFALKGLEDDEDLDDYDDDGDTGGADLTTSEKSKKKDKKKKKEKQKNYDDDEEDEEDEEEEETWGRGKAAYYSSNAAQLESDDEEGHEMEEQEAKRLQKKALEGMTDDDFGLNDRHEISRADKTAEYVYMAFLVQADIELLLF